jgi:hypothetical protein
MQEEIVVLSDTRSLTNTIKRLDRVRATIVDISDDRSGIGSWRIRVIDMPEKAIKRFDVLQSKTA